MNVWVWSINEENWPTVKSQKVWAVDTEIKSKKVQNGDRIIFYVKAEPRSYCFQGIYEVVSDWHPSTLQWGDRETVLEVELREIETGFADVRKLENKLEFITQRDKSTGYLGLALKASSYGPSNNATPISDHDYKIILEEMQSQKSEPPLGDPVDTNVERPDSHIAELKNAPIRLHLVKSLFENLIGPKMGPGEEIENPTYSYVVGVLRSKFKRDEQPKSTDPSERGSANPTPVVESDPNEEVDEQKILADYDLNPMLGARSIGLSFVVKGSAPRVKMCFTWGRYTTSPISSRLWRRETNFYIKEFDLATKIPKITPSEGESETQRITKEGIEIRIHSMRLTESEDESRVSVFLINNTKYDGYHQSATEYVFQPQIRINCLQNTQLRDLGHLDSDEDSNENLLYLKRHNFGNGRFCGVLWKDVDPEDHESSEGGFSSFTWTDSNSKYFPKNTAREFTRPDIRTEFFPTYSILQPDLSDKSNTNFNAGELSEKWNSDDLSASLGKIVKKYDVWISSEREDLEKKSLSEKLRRVAEENLEKCKMSCDRISGGIEFLKTNEKARAAFCFMNKVIALKTEWESRDRQNAKPFEWWEFQMAFILQCLRGVAQDNDKERDMCDVLWFPTGGGKTEAYLGLMAFAICYRRLQNNDDFNSDGGISVISRYTLRLLTIQQFQRALGAIVAADYLRATGWVPKSMNLSDLELRKRIDKKTLWGKSRFSIGIWIGGDATPNRFKDDFSRHTKTRILHAEGMLKDNNPVHTESKGEPAQVINCPCCGSIVAIPSSEAGLEEKTSTIYWIFRSGKSLNELEKIPAGSLSGGEVEVDNGGMKIFSIGNATGSRGTKYYCIRVQFKNKFPKMTLNGGKVNSWWNIHVSKVLGDDGAPAVLESTAPSRPGYFYVKDGSDAYDFVIHCPSPECELNKIQWFENLSDNSVVPTGTPFKIPDDPQRSLFMPISAYTVDEQIYRRCPSMLIATVDKFAMIPYFPDAASLFGNIDVFHRHRGYGRAGVSNFGDSANPQDIIRVSRQFLPPSLIIQDELHLIEGPLGSLFGTYELAMDILLTTNKSRPKYIASSATVKEARSQVGTIFRRGVFVFPPAGTSVDDSYFFENKEDRKSNSDKAGRLYLGICAPTKILTIPVRIWATLLSEIYKIRKNPDAYGLRFQYENSDAFKSGKSYDCFVTEKTDWYWTLVGYFNAIKELQIARSLYGDDIARDVNTFSSEIFSSIDYRLQGSRLRPAIRFVPIKISHECLLEKVSAYCQNTAGQISVAIYDNKQGSHLPDKLVRKIVEEDREKDCANGENEFRMEQPYAAKAGETVWVGIANNDDGTRFQTGSSGMSSYYIQSQKKDIEHLMKDYEFPLQLTGIEKEKITIRVSVSTIPRHLGFEPIELTGQTDSQDLPHILKAINKTPSEVDGVFTTAVFGTGIDIQRLGLMVVMGQPKTTSSYIQSTGRVGRKVGGLVVTWLKASNVRDLNHYENFVGYHRMLHRYVEPVSASPYSEEALRLCLGPICVGILRNSRMIGNSPVSRGWIDGITGPMRMATNSDDAEVKALSAELKKMMTDPVIPSTRRPSVNYANEKIDNTISSWQKDALNLKNAGEDLVYNQWTIQDPPDKNVVLGTLQHEIAKFTVVYKNARTSMREVESTANFGE